MGDSRRRAKASCPCPVRRPVAPDAPMNNLPEVGCFLTSAQPLLRIHPLNLVENQFLSIAHCSSLMFS